MRNKLEVDFQTEDEEMERIWEKHIEPNFVKDGFEQKKCVEDLWNDETISDNVLVSCLLGVGKMNAVPDLDPVNRLLGNLSEGL